MFFKYAFQMLFKRFLMGLKCFYMCFLQRFFQALLKTPLKRFETFGSNAFKHILQTLFERRFLTHLITLFQLIPRCFLKTFSKTIFYNALLSTTLLKAFYFEIVVFKTLSQNPFSNAFTVLLQTLCSNALIIYFSYTFWNTFQNALFKYLLKRFLKRAF